MKCVSCHKNLKSEAFKGNHHRLSFHTGMTATIMSRPICDDCWDDDCVIADFERKEAKEEKRI